jgi:hypothetical protein
MRKDGYCKTMQQVQEADWGLTMKMKVSAFDGMVLILMKWTTFLLLLNERCQANGAE